MDKDSLITELQATIKDLRQDKTELRRDKTELQSKIAELQSTIAELRREKEGHRTRDREEAQEQTQTRPSKRRGVLGDDGIKREANHEPEDDDSIEVIVNPAVVWTVEPAVAPTNDPTMDAAIAQTNDLTVDAAIAHTNDLTVDAAVDPTNDPTVEHEMDLDTIEPYQPDLDDGDDIAEHNDADLVIALISNVPKSRYTIGSNRRVVELLLDAHPGLLDWCQSPAAYWIAAAARWDADRIAVYPVSNHIGTAMRSALGNRATITGRDLRGVSYSFSWLSDTPRPPGAQQTDVRTTYAWPGHLTNEQVADVTRTHVTTTEAYMGFSFVPSTD